jgi:hypothetical protein
MPNGILVTETRAKKKWHTKLQIFCVSGKNPGKSKITELFFSIFPKVSDRRRRGKNKPSTGILKHSPNTTFPILQTATTLMPTSDDEQRAQSLRALEYACSIQNKKQPLHTTPMPFENPFTFSLPAV